MCVSIFVLIKQIAIGFSNNVGLCNGGGDLYVLSEKRRILHSYCRELAATNVVNQYYSHTGNYILLNLVVRNRGNINTVMSVFQIPSRKYN